MELKNKTAIVCGSTQGIGFASAKKIAEQGATVVLLARNEKKLQKAVGELPVSNEQKHTYLVADFSQPQEVRQVVSGWIEDGNTANILVNNTGGPKGGPIKDAPVEEFLAAFNQHLICNHILAQTLYPGMQKSGYGRIVNIISTSVKQPLPNLGVSNTVRGAVANWSKTLANELGEYGITVNNVLPGATDTTRLKNIVENKATKTEKDKEEILNAMAELSPMKRIAQPNEVANAVVFLVSPQASYINGINVPVDGGRTKSL